MDTEHQCFCELAPLYALGVLSDRDREWVENQIAECPDLAMELANYEATVATLSYSAPDVPMAPNLKDRLFQRIGKQTPAPQPPQPPSIAFPGAIARLLERGMTSFLNQETTRFNDLKWEPYAIPGVMIARLHTDFEKRELVGLLRAEPGAHYPLHSHGGVEEIFMLQGDLVDGSKVYGSGDYIRTVPGTVHAPHTWNGCMFFFRVSLDNEFLEAVPVGRR
ncbi:MAG: anti-sigma factor [Leptolyngbyaceae cyanobacterium RU_5_1]|nr:anti-sigma factor [Leptolyngbyaceae cyanobacterium RU_5_1]